MSNWLDKKNTEELVDLSEQIDTRLFKTPVDNTRSELELVGENPDEANRFLANWGKFSGLSTGLWNVDEITYGFEKGELIVLAGEPGIGKSAFVCNLAVNFAEQGAIPTVISLELTSAQLKSRIGKAYGEGWEELPILFQKVQFINRKDLSGIVENAVKAKSKIIIVDYLQMLKDDTDNEHREVSRIIKELKLMALDNKIVVVAISALNRARDTEKGLQMRDLHGSGAIEYFADQIIFLERGGAHGSVNVKIVKNRSSPIDFEDNKRPLTFDGALFKAPQNQNKLTLEDPFK